MNYFVIGIIVNTQGLAGEVRVVPTTDDPARFTLLKGDDVELFTERGEKLVRRVESVRFHKRFVILKFQDADSIDDAQKLKNTVIKIPREKALPLAKDEYYTKDLYDMRVFTEDGEDLGVIADVLATGANDVYVVSKDGNEPLLIPAIKSCVLSVDVTGRVMTVRLMEGLRAR